MWPQLKNEVEFFAWLSDKVRKKRRSPIKFLSFHGGSTLNGGHWAEQVHRIRARGSSNDSANKSGFFHCNHFWSPSGSYSSSASSSHPNWRWPREKRWRQKTHWRFLPCPTGAQIFFCLFIRGFIMISLLLLLNCWTHTELCTLCTHSHRQTPQKRTYSHHHVRWPDHRERSFQKPQHLLLSSFLDISPYHRCCC